MAGELKGMGVLQGGVRGMYDIRLTMALGNYTYKSSMTADGAPLKFNTDFVPLPAARAPKPIQNGGVIFGGTAGDTATMISPEQAAGKFVVLLPAPGQPSGGRGGRGGGGAFGTTVTCSTLLNPMGGSAPTAGRRGAFGGGGNAAATRFANAAAIATVDLDIVPIGDPGFLNIPPAQPQPYPPAGDQPAAIIHQHTCT